MRAITHTPRGSLLILKIKLVLSVIAIVMTIMYIRNPVLIYEHSKSINSYAHERMRANKNEFIRVEFGDLAYQTKLTMDTWGDFGRDIAKCGRDFVGFWVFVFKK